MDDFTLVLRTKKGDETAFYSLMMNHKEQLFKIAYSYLKNEQDALEAIQEVTFRAFKHIRKLKEPDFFSTWLIRILINHCNDELHKKKRLEMKADFREELAFTVDNLSRIEMEEALDTLDEKYRQIIILKYFHDLKIKDIAALLECPEGTIKTWLNKALKELRKYLEDVEGTNHV